MWCLIILGGGVAVLVLGPLDFGNAYHERVGASVAKAVAAITLVVLWIIVLVRLMRYVFRQG